MQGSTPPHFMTVCDTKYIIFKFVFEVMFLNVIGFVWRKFHFACLLLLWPVKQIFCISMCILTVALTLSTGTDFCYWMFTVNQVVSLLVSNLQLTDTFSTTVYITNFQYSNKGKYNCFIRLYFVLFHLVY
jgi:hypothetical protein